MGESHCSKIAIMQLFHELKQQFPALPDHVVSQCITQNLYDRETCERTLRVTQESRPSPGAFPPPAPVDVPIQPGMMSQNLLLTRNAPHCHLHRPASLNIEDTILRDTVINQRAFASLPPSASAATADKHFFEDPPNRPTIPSNAGFELNVNVACSPVSNSNFRTISTADNCKRNDFVEPQPHSSESLRATTTTTATPSTSKLKEQVDHARSYTSVSFTLRSPSSEARPPIEIRSQGSSLTYSTSSLDPRGFQSHLQISIGPGSVSNVSAARIKPPLSKVRPNSLVPLSQTMAQKPPGLPTGPPNQSSRPTKVMSAPTTPSNPSRYSSTMPSNSLPSTPVSAPESNLSPSNIGKNTVQNNDIKQIELSTSEVITDDQKELIEKQLARKNKLAEALKIEKDKLEAMKKEVQALGKSDSSSVKPEDEKRKLQSDIYQLLVECDLLAKEIDRRSEQRAPLGETDEEFYRSIYTGQRLIPNSGRALPPLPSRPLVWQLPPDNDSSATNNSRNDDSEEKFGPSWICLMCTFANHPLIKTCEQCNMPRNTCHNTPGETQDIHIRVTHRHNFPSRRK